MPKKITTFPPSQIKARLVKLESDKVRLEADTVLVIEELLAAGKTPMEIAEMLGMKYQRVLYLVQKKGSGSVPTTTRRPREVVAMERTLKKKTLTALKMNATRRGLVFTDPTKDMLIRALLDLEFPGLSSKS